MIDLIKREDAIEAVWKPQVRPNGAIFDALKAAIESEIKAIPSADRPQGEWIWDNDAVDWNLGAWICSNCHARNDNLPHSEIITPLRWSGSRFCPNCGCRMKGADDE